MGGESESLHLVLEPDTEELLDDSQNKKEEEEMKTVVESRSRHKRYRSYSKLSKLVSPKIFIV